MRTIRSNLLPKKRDESILLKERRQGIQSCDRALTWVIILAVGLLPLLIRVHTGQFIEPRFIGDAVGTSIRGEGFTYYKTMFLYILAIIALDLLLQKMLLYRWEIRSSYINIPLLLLTLTILLSGILSQEKGIAILGLYNRHEGSLTYLAYFLLFFAAANTRYKDWFKRFIIGGITLVLLVNVVIILFEFYGHDLFQYATVKSLLAADQTSGKLLSTFNNPNYVSGFAAALTAFFLALALRGSGWKQQITGAIGSILGFVMMIVAISTSGWVSLAATLPILILIGWRSGDVPAALRTGAIVLAGWVLVFLSLNSYNPAVGHEPLRFLQSTLHQTIGELQNNQFEDENTTRDEFSLPAAGVSAGSGRTYIWRETLKLIQARPLLGYGQDTLTYHFPQDDPGKIGGLGGMDPIVDKPHNVYLEIAYGSGLIALAALFILLIQYLYFSCRSLFAPADRTANGFQAALFAFCLAFVFQWLFNDSIVGTSVIFWTLLGISVSLGTPEPDQEQSARQN